ncbi:hypothetical protein HZC53_00830 [Candidatus Uhrbacteria bacterium]|nr:hypothetical protein [Candidatus Uhrbacteria bacterium]
MEAKTHLSTRLLSRHLGVGLLVVLQVAFFAFGILKPSAVQASIPTTLGYQGRLKNAAGTAQTGTFSFVFRIYTSSTGGVAVWSETQPAVSVDTGAFAVQLGSATAFPASLDFNQPLFLTLEVNSDGEMSPRISLNSVPFSYTTGGINAFSAAPVSATGGRMYYDTLLGTLNYYDGIAASWQQVGTATGTLQSITNAGNVTTNAIQFAGGTSTGAFVFNSALTVSGSTNLQNLTATNATLTSLVITGTTPTNLSNLTWTNATGTYTTTTNLAVLTSARLPSDTRINSTTVCLSDGTNCPSGVSGSLQSVTNAGNTTTNAIIVYGGITTSNFTATGTTSLLGMTFSNGTGTSVTTTNLAVLTGLSLPTNSVTDAMVVNGLTIDQTGNVSATSINSGVLGNAGVTLNLSGFGSVTGSLAATHVSMATVNTTQTLDAQKLYNIWQSNTVLTGGDLSTFASGTVQVSGGTGFIRNHSTDNFADEVLTEWATSTSLLTPLVWTNIYIYYNSGVPSMVATTTSYDDDFQYLPIGKVFNEGNGNLMLHDDRIYATQIRKNLSSMLRENMKHILANGCEISSTGTRNLYSTACDDWYGVSKKAQVVFDSAASDYFTADYRNGNGGWKGVTTTQWDNLNYDDGSGTLQPLGAGEYGVHWIYRHEPSSNKMDVVYGRSSYTTLADALAAPEPTSPPAYFLDEQHVTLVAAIIFVQGSNSITEIRDLRPHLVSRGATSGNGGGVTNHNDLSGLQGGSSGQFYHLTSTGFDANSSLHFTANSGGLFTLLNNATTNTKITINNLGGGTASLDLIDGDLLLASTTRITNAGFAFLTGADLAGGGITNAGALSGISNLTATGTTSLATLTFTNGTATSVTSTNLFSTNAVFTNLTVTNPFSPNELIWISATGTYTTSTYLYALSGNIPSLGFLQATGTYLAVTGTADFHNISFDNATGGNLVTYGTVSSTFIQAGDTVLNNTTAHTMVVDTILRVGVGNFPVIGNSVAQFGGTTDTFLQVNIQNHSSGTNASSDFVATNDIGDDASYYIDMGINGSNYSVPEFNIGGANDGYLYTNGHNLTIGTASASTAVIFHAGGTTASDEVMRITSDHFVGIGTTAPSSTFHVVGTSTMDGLLTVTTASSSILFFGSSTGTSLSILTLARLPSDTKINNTAVCLLDGTNCPSGTSPNFQTVTNTGNTTTRDIQFNGGTSTGAFVVGSNLTVTGTTALQGLTFINASGYYVDYSTTTANPAAVEGRLFYDKTQKALAYYNDNLNAPRHIGQEVALRVRNLTGTPITRGSLVRVVGNDGAGLPTIALARANDQNTSNATGAADEDIANGAAGTVITEGTVDDLDTSAFSAGDRLYLSAATSGALTNVRPLTPNITLEVGAVSKSDALTGSIILHFITPKFGAITTGGVTFGDTNNFITDAASVFFFDATNTRLGIGTNAPSSTLHVVGSTQLQTLTFTNGTGTSVTTTNLFTTNGTATNFVSTNVTITGGTINGTSIGLTTPSLAVFSDVTSTNATTTNLAVLTMARLPSDTKINNTAVCLLDGTNCPSSTSANLQTVTNSGNTTTNAIVYNGGTSTGAFVVGANLTVTGTTALQGLTFNNATGLYIDFATTTANPAYLEGRLFYDNTEKALSYYNDSSDVTLNIGQENFIRVRNMTGSTIPNGKAVYISGSDTAGVPSVELAQADSTTTARVVAIATQNIPAGSTGYVTSFGLVHDIDTSAFATSSVLYLSAATPGELTTTKPMSPNLTISIGVVSKSHSVNGHILVLIGVVRAGQMEDKGVAFGNINGEVTSDQAYLSWDDVTKRLGVGTDSPSSTLHVVGSTTLQTLIFTEGTSTSVTSTNLFTTNGTVTNFITGNALITGGTINGASIGLTTPSLALFSNVSSTNATTTNFEVLTYARLPSDTKVNNTSICLLDGTNCPSGVSSNLQVVTNSGNTTTNSIIVYGGITTSNLTATGTISLQGTTFTLATGTAATTTNLFSTYGTFTNGVITNGTIASLTYTNGTSTSWLGFATASGTTINALNSNLTGLVWVNATGTNTTSTNLGVTGLATIASLSVSGVTSLAGVTWTSATGTNTTSTNLGVSNLALITNLTVTGTTGLQTLTFTNGTGTSATTTNFFSTNGRFNLLAVSSTDVTGNTLSVAADSITSGNGLVIDYTSTNLTSGSAFLIRNGGQTEFAVGSASGLAWNATGTKSAIFTLATSTAYLQVATGNLIVGNSTSSATQSLDGNDAYIKGDLEVDGRIRFDGNVLLAGAATSAQVGWSNANNDPTNFESVRSLRSYNGYLYAGMGDTGTDGRIYICNPTLGGSSTLCDNSADWSLSTSTGATQVLSMSMYNGKMYAGTSNGLVVMCSPSTSGNINQCDSGDWSIATSTLASNSVKSMVNYNGYFYASEDTGLAGSAAVIACNPASGGNVNDCDNAADWTHVPLQPGGTYEIAPSLVVFLNRLYAGLGNSNADRDLDICNPTLGGNTEICDSTADWALTVNNGTSGAPASYETMAVYNQSLYLGGGASTGLGDLLRCDPANDAGTDFHLCDGTTLNNEINNAGTITRIPSLLTYNGSLWVGAEGTSAGDGSVVEWRDTYASTSLAGGTFQATYALAEYNGVMYAGRGNAAGNGQVFYMQEARTASNKLSFDAGSSTGDIWFSQESYDSMGQGADPQALQGAFKFSHGIVTEAGSYDLAEMYPATEADLQAGDVVALDSVVKGSISRSTKAYDPKALGVISTKPGFTLSAEQKEGMLPVALAGRVPVKFSTENGTIKIGDALTAASTTGYAMKATRQGVMIGRALQDFSLPQDAASTTVATGTVLMFVQNGYYLPGTEDFGSLSLGDATGTSDGLQETDSTPEIQLPAGSQISQGLGVGTLVVRDATFTGKVIVLGTTTLRGPVIFGATNSGRIKVEPGQYRIPVLFEEPYAYAPRVFVSPEIEDISGGTGYDHSIWDGGYYLTDVTSTGFEIRLPGGGYCPTVGLTPCPISLSFNWFVVGFESATPTSSLPETPTTTAPVEEVATTTDSGTETVVPETTPTTDPAPVESTGTTDVPVTPTEEPAPAPVAEETTQPTVEPTVEPVPTPTPPAEVPVTVEPAPAPAPPVEVPAEPVPAPVPPETPAS